MSILSAKQQWPCIINSVTTRKRRNSHPFLLTFVSTVGNGNSHIFTAVIVLRFGWRGSEAADTRFRRRAERGHAVCRVIGTCGHLVRGAVRDETLCNGELGMLQVLLQLGVLVGPCQLLIGGRGALC